MIHNKNNKLKWKSIKSSREGKEPLKNSLLYWNSKTPKEISKELRNSKGQEIHV